MITAKLTGYFSLPATSRRDRRREKGHVIWPPLACWSFCGHPAAGFRAAGQCPGTGVADLARQHARRAALRRSRAKALPDLDYWRLDDQSASGWRPTPRCFGPPTIPRCRPSSLFTAIAPTPTRRWRRDGARIKSIRSQTDRPLRYVIWSWPADREFRRNRARRSPEGRLQRCGSLVSGPVARRVSPGRPGEPHRPQFRTADHHRRPRTCWPAGRLAGRRLPESTVAAWTTGKRNPIRAVLLAAALDADWLAPGGCHERALSLVGSDAGHLQRLRSRLAVVPADVRPRRAAGHGLRRAPAASKMRRTSRWSTSAPRWAASTITGVIMPSRTSTVAGASIRSPRICRSATRCKNGFDSPGGSPVSGRVALASRQCESPPGKDARAPNRLGEVNAGTAGISQRPMDSGVRRGSDR